MITQFSTAPNRDDTGVGVYQNVHHEGGVNRPVENLVIKNDKMSLIVQPENSLVPVDLSIPPLGMNNPHYKG